MSESASQQPVQITDRVIAEISDYQQLLDAMRLRAQERQIAISSEDANDVVCLPDHYLAKLLAPRPVKRVGMISLGPVLQVLGVKLIMVEDESALRWINARLGKRKSAFMRSGAVHVTLSRRFLQKIGALGGANSRKNIGKRYAKTLARQAAIARWNGVKKAEKAARI
jgi:hypothetical protein